MNSGLHPQHDDAAGEPSSSFSTDHGPTAGISADASAAASITGSATEELHLPSTLELSEDSSEEFDDQDSGLGFSFQDSTTSLRPSIYNFIRENGRTYHAFNSGKYMLPNDEAEQQRLNLQHQQFKIYLEGKLHMAPIVYPRRVLDIGTGTGIWAIEFAQDYPDSEVIGTDLSPIQPRLLPPNCSFEIGDAEEEDWGFDQPFDYIHARAMVTSFRDGRPLIQRIFENLAPGGYFELQDPCLPLRCDDGTLEGTALAEWNRLVDEGMLRMGRNVRDNLSWGRYMREVGFEDLAETRAACAFNTWPKGDKNKVLGALGCQNLLEAVQSVSMALFTRVLGMSAKEVLDFLELVKRDIRNKGVHAYCSVYFVYGRKPIDYGLERTKEDIKKTLES